MPKTSKSVGTPMTELTYQAKNLIFYPISPKVFIYSNSVLWFGPMYHYPTWFLSLRKKRGRWGRFLYMLLHLPTHYSKNFRTFAIKWMHGFYYSIKNGISLSISQPIFILPVDVIPASWSFLETFTSSGTSTGNSKKQFKSSCPP